MRVIKIATESDYLIRLEGSEYEEKEIGIYKASCRLTFSNGLKLRVQYDDNRDEWRFDILGIGDGAIDIKAVKDGFVIETDGDVISHEVQER